MDVCCVDIAKRALDRILTLEAHINKLEEYYENSTTKELLAEHNIQVIQEMMDSLANNTMYCGIDKISVSEIRGYMKTLLQWINRRIR